MSCHRLNSSGCVDSDGLVMSYTIMNSLSTKLCFHKLILKDVVVTRHRTLVADLADDVSHIYSFASRDASLLDNKEFNHTCSLFVGQAGDLDCFKCPSCAKPYISTIWFQKHHSKCPQRPAAITGLN